MDINISLSPYSNHIERGDRWITKATELYKVKQAILQLEHEHKKLLAELKELSDNTNSRGGNLVFTRSERLGSVQYKDIPQLKGVDLNPYRGAPVEMWKLDVVLEVKNSGQEN